MDPSIQKWTRRLSGTQYMGAEGSTARLQALVDMGFSPVEARLTLEATSGNVERAAELLKAHRRERERAQTESRASRASCRSMPTSTWTSRQDPLLLARVHALWRLDYTLDEIDLALNREGFMNSAMQRWPEKSDKGVLCRILKLPRLTSGVATASTAAMEWWEAAVPAPAAVPMPPTPPPMPPMQPMPHRTPPPTRFDTLPCDLGEQRGSGGPTIPLDVDVDEESDDDDEDEEDEEEDDDDDDIGRRIRCSG